MFDTDGTTRLSAPNYRAALFAGPTVAALAQVGPGVEFRSGGTAGYFTGGNRVIPTVEPGQSATFQYRVLILDGTAKPDRLEREYTAFSAPSATRSQR